MMQLATGRRVVELWKETIQAAFFKVNRLGVHMTKDYYGLPFSMFIEIALMHGARNVPFYQSLASLRLCSKCVIMPLSQVLLVLFESHIRDIPYNPTIFQHLNRHPLSP